MGSVSGAELSPALLDPLGSMGTHPWLRSPFSHPSSASRLSPRWVSGAVLGR